MNQMSEKCIEYRNYKWILRNQEKKRRYLGKECSELFQILFMSILYCLHCVLQKKCSLRIISMFKKDVQREVLFKKKTMPGNPIFQDKRKPED